MKSICSDCLHTGDGRETGDGCTMFFFVLKNDFFLCTMIFLGGGERGEEDLFKRRERTPLLSFLSSTSSLSTPHPTTSHVTRPTKKTQNTFPDFREEHKTFTFHLLSPFPRQCDADRCKCSQSLLVAFFFLFTSSCLFLNL